MSWVPTAKDSPNTTMEPSNDDLGQIGQSTLETWAAQVGAVANPSKRDLKGWDFILQFAAASSSEKVPSPLDRALPEISCMVQVKTSLVGTESWSIKLSNWRRMVSDPIPWFVLVIDLNEHHVPHAGYLVHIDDAWCSKVLMRLRELGESSIDTLHKHTLELRWSDADLLPTLNGRALVERITSHIPMGQHAYVRHKIACYNSIGYNGSPREFTVSMHVSDMAEFWRGAADLGLGIRRNFPGYTGTTVYDRRFGVLGKTASLEVSDGEVEFVPSPVGEARMCLADPRSGSRIEHECDVYRAGASFPFLPQEYEKLRFAAKYLSLVVPFLPRESAQPAYPSFQVDFPHGEPVARRDLVPLMSTLALFRGATDMPLELHLEGQAGESPWDFTITLARPPLPDGLKGLLEDMEIALRVIDRFDVPSDAPIEPETLRAQMDVLRFLDAALGEKEGPLTSGTLQDISVGNIYGVPIEAVVDLPKHVLYTSIGIYGTVTELNELPQGRLLTVAAPQALIECEVIAREVADSFDYEARRQDMDERLRALGCEFLHPRPTNEAV